MELKKFTTKDFGYLRIFDLYSEEELKSIWNEIFHLDYIIDQMEFYTQSENSMTRTRALRDDGSPKMSGGGVFLDEMYRDRKSSPILTHNRKLFSDENISQSIGESHVSNKVQYITINKDKTLLNRYRDSHEYHPHEDAAIFSAITVLLHKPEKIRGGEFSFSNYDETFESINNSCIIFPSWVEHSVSSLNCIDDSRRYSISQFMYIL